MPERRITNGQRAAVCGLVLVGVSYRKACLVAGIGHRTMRPYVLEDWRRPALPIPLREMTESQRRVYAKLREILPRSEAFAEAMR